MSVITSYDLPYAFFTVDKKATILTCNEVAFKLFQGIVKPGAQADRIFTAFDTSKTTFLGRLDDKPFLFFLKEWNIEDRNELACIALSGEDYAKMEEHIKGLNKFNRELDAIIENSYDGIYITDNKGNTLKTNSAIERISGIPKHYYIGKNVKDLIERGILKESITAKVLETKKTVNIIQKNYNQKETMMTGSPILDEKGEIDKVVTNIRDLSELNHLHEHLKEVQELNKKYEVEVERLKAYTKQDPEVVIKSEKMIEIFNIADRLANVETTVLITGETGVGKDVLARHIYRVSDRSDKGELIKINCGAIPKDLLESELFGYEAGAFSGASSSGKPGVFELANNGIIFLDEVGDMPHELQVKLLRVLQEKEIQRVGGTKLKYVDVRVIAATNKDLKKMVNEGLFREDLYYRLHVVPVHVPSLRDRKEDILPLVESIREKYNKKYELSKKIDRTLKEFFYHYDWPGNVRELANLVERMMLTTPANELTFHDLPEEYKQDNCYMFEETILPLKESVEKAEKQTLLLAAKKWSTTYEVAKHLKTSQATIVRKLQKYNIKLED
ncbi:Fis family transcriptional regulator [Salipaludibacillus keqinensis]|uniref:HTH-type transcriptional regulatory protein TyrR n=1 Tax=Salipaludibacillus keqinensis TaxID=2045207 RepID=A0A323TE17_9BACI|nr:sigma 54-interacting transcriptional regulator [Salipaludibacillus keqinensis]PYZ92990.1 Fis family transcriptional regulator [Salipaludibacillus keqinensis]